MQRYRSINQFLKEKFGVRVFKISLNGGFSCPNRDGTKNSFGCIYCNPESNRPAASRGKNIKDQLVEGIEYARKRHHAGKFIPYFQHFSNTYADISVLKKLYHDAITHPDVVGLSISTRPDCISDETLKLLEDLGKKTFLWLELGLQSANDKTLNLLNRSHTVRDFCDAVNAAHGHGINTCAHIILGLPDETRVDMLHTIKTLNILKIGGIKIHNLHVLKNTVLAGMYARGEINMLTQKEYASLVVDCLEHLSPDVLIHRFNSHSPRNLTITPEWSVNKLGTLNAVHAELERRNTWQGKLFNPAQQSRNSSAL